MGSSQSTFVKDVGKEMKRLLDLSPGDYQRKFSKQASDVLESRGNASKASLCEDIVKDMNDSALFPSYSPWFNNRKREYELKMTLKLTSAQAHQIELSAVEHVIELYRQQFTFMSESQALDMIAKEGFDSFELF